MDEPMAAECADLLNCIEKEVARLAQTFTNIIILTGKPQGGVSPIALMPLLNGLWTMIRRAQIRLWDVGHTGPWDAATEAVQLSGQQ